MVTYCIGSARQKRTYFFGDKSAVILDNAEVLFCASEDGRNYFAFGDLPFSDFTVVEYLEYACALKGNRVTREMIEAFSVDPDTRIKRLRPAQYRCIQLLEKTGALKQKRLVINLDGATYSQKDMISLDALIDIADETFVCITDKRFMTKSKREYKILSFGKQTKKSRPRFYAARILAKRMGAKKVAIM